MHTFILLGSSGSISSPCLERGRLNCRNSACLDMSSVISVHYMKLCIALKWVRYTEHTSL